MKRIFTLLTAFAVMLSSISAFAAEPDKPGTKLITIQGGYGPGIGAILSGNIAMANLGAGHLYGGLQVGGYFRHGATTGVRKIDLSLAPRVMLGFPLGNVVELHVGGLAGIDMARFDDLKSSLVFCYGGFGGMRLNLSDSMGIVLEGCYSNCLPYATAGLAFRF